MLSIPFKSTHFTQITSLTELLHKIIATLECMPKYIYLYTLKKYLAKSSAKDASLT